jgi:outer membrane protein assembly factor BamB
MRQRFPSVQRVQRPRTVSGLAAAYAGAALLAVLDVTGAAKAASFVTFQGGVAHTGYVSEPGLNPPLRRAWQHRFPGEVSYPVIAEGKVFVVAYDSGFDEKPRGVSLVVLSAASGRQLWARNLNAQHAALAYEAGRVFARTWPRDEGSSLRAFAAADGTELWSRPVGSGGGPPAVDGGAVYVSQDGVSAYRTADGALLWQALSAYSDFESPAVSGDTVYAAYSCEKLAARRSDGAVLWRRRHAGADRRAPVHARRPTSAPRRGIRRRIGNTTPEHPRRLPARLRRRSGRVP